MTLSTFYCLCDTRIHIMYVCYSNPRKRDLLCAVVTCGCVITLKHSLTFRGPCIVIYSYNKSQRDALYLIFI